MTKPDMKQSIPRVRMRDEIKRLEGKNKEGIGMTKKRVKRANSLNEQKKNQKVSSDVTENFRPCRPKEDAAF